MATNTILPVLLSIMTNRASERQATRNRQVKSVSTSTFITEDDWFTSTGRLDTPYHHHHHDRHYPASGPESPTDTADATQDKPKIIRFSSSSENPQPLSIPDATSSSGEKSGGRKKTPFFKKKLFLLTSSNLQLIQVRQQEIHHSHLHLHLTNYSLKAVVVRLNSNSRTLSSLKTILPVLFAQENYPLSMSNGIRKENVDKGISRRRRALKNLPLDIITRLTVILTVKF